MPSPGPDELTPGRVMRNALGSSSTGSGALKPTGFILPCQPYLAERPPSGPDWQHEIKWDGRTPHQPLARLGEKETR